MWLVVGSLLLMGVGYWNNVDHHIGSFMLNVLTSEQEKKAAIWLPQYQAIIQSKVINCVDSNLSDITYNKQDQLFYLVVNSPTKVVVVNEQGECLNQVDLQLEDTEALVWVKDNQFIISEERKFKVSLLEINPESENGYQIKDSISLDFLKDKNLGLEALAYNTNSQSIITTKEKSPILFYEIVGLVKNSLNRSDIKIKWLFKKKRFDIDDLSGMYFHSKTGHTMLLSDESQMLVEINQKGSTLSYIDLEKGLYGFKSSIPQAEGITMDDNDNIYIVSEPNLFYKLSPAQ